MLYIIPCISWCIICAYDGTDMCCRGLFVILFASSLYVYFAPKFLLCFLAAFLLSYLVPLSPCPSPSLLTPGKIVLSSGIHSLLFLAASFFSCVTSGRGGVAHRGIHVLERSIRLIPLVYSLVLVLVFSLVSLLLIRSENKVVLLLIPYKHLHIYTLLSRPTSSRDDGISSVWFFGRSCPPIFLFLFVANICNNLVLIRSLHQSELP